MLVISVDAHNADRNKKKNSDKKKYRLDGK